MHTIEVDFEVFKKLMIMRETEVVTYNDVLRRVLGIEPCEVLAPVSIDNGSLSMSGAWITKGVVFSEGTEFRANYKGEIVRGRVESGALVVGGKRYESPSAAATAVTGNSVNGWIFWECKKLGSNSWKMLKLFRKGL